MLGIYIHIPFCKQKCHYCDFFSSTNTDKSDSFLNSLYREIAFKSDPKREVDTLYIGGGTPSVLGVKELRHTINLIRAAFSFTEDAEICLEANPDDLDLDTLKAYRDIGINRLSIGIQSFRDEYLNWMNRRHNAAQAQEVVKNCEKTGFDNLSIDLIYGLPDLKLNDWQEDLNRLRDMPVTHLSAYHLTIEPNTVFGRRKRRGELQEIPDQQSLDQFLVLRELSEYYGFEHYEISNFARNKAYSRHNTKYWLGHPYIGLGPSAHEYDGSRRSWNPASLTAYDRLYAKDNPDIEQEVLKAVDIRNELIMTGLRSIFGITKVRWEEAGIDQSWYDFQKQCAAFEASGQMLIEEDLILLKPHAWFVADGIISELFA